MLSWGDFNQNWLFVLAVFFATAYSVLLILYAPQSAYSSTCQLAFLNLSLWPQVQREKLCFWSDNIIQSSNWFSMAQIESFWLVGFSFHPVYQCVYLNRLNCFCVHWNKEFRCMKLNLQHNFNVYCFEKRGLAPANPSRFLVTELPNWV